MSLSTLPSLDFYHKVESYMKSKDKSKALIVQSIVDFLLALDEQMNLINGCFLKFRQSVVRRQVSIYSLDFVQILIKAQDYASLDTLLSQDVLDVDELVVIALIYNPSSLLELISKCNNMSQALNHNVDLWIQYCIDAGQEALSNDLVKLKEQSTPKKQCKDKKSKLSAVQQQLKDMNLNKEDLLELMKQLE